MTDRRFIAGGRLDGRAFVHVGATAIVDAFPIWRAIVERQCGAETAALFAEPEFSRGNGAAPSRLDWYSNLEGPILALDDLGASERSAVEAKLVDRLEKLGSLFSDPEVGPFVTGALNFGAPRPVLAIGPDPVLTDWGLLSAPLLTDDHTRRAALQTALPASIADCLPLPPRSREEWASKFAAAGGEESGGGASKVGASRVLPSLGGAVLPWLIAGVLALTLALSFWSGLLRFPGAGGSALGTGAPLADQGVLEGLRAQRARLSAAQGLTCDAIIGELPRLVPQRPEKMFIMRRPDATRPTGAAPSTLATVSGEAGSRPVGAVRLSGLIAASTVMVVAGDGTGSGFFLDQQTVVTNRHVVEGADEAIVIGAEIGLLRATSIRRSVGGPTSDFALLTVDRHPKARPLRLSAAPAPLTGVVSSGYPGFQLRTDPIFRRLLAGDADAAGALSPVFGTGVVNHLQREGGTTVILHGAEIAPGSSGAPLTDYCGRVVGINTFLRAEDTLPVIAKYALGSDGLLSFLRSLGRDDQVSDAPCEVSGSQTTTLDGPRTAPAAASPAAGQGQR